MFSFRPQICSNVYESPQVSDSFMHGLHGNQVAIQLTVKSCMHFLIFACLLCIRSIVHTTCSPRPSVVLNEGGTCALNHSKKCFKNRNQAAELNPRESSPSLESTSFDISLLTCQGNENITKIKYIYSFSITISNWSLSTILSGYLRQMKKKIDMLITTL